MKKHYLCLFILIIQTLFISCTLYSYIGEWSEQPKTDGWANYKYRIFLEFPDQNWKVFTHPSKELTSLNLNWPPPYYTEKAYYILMAVEYDSDFAGKSKWTSTIKKFPGSQSEKKVISDHLWKTFFLDYKQARTIFYLAIKEVSEYITLEDFITLQKDSFDKYIVNEFWKRQFDIEKYEFKELEFNITKRNGKDLAIMRHQISDKSNTEMSSIHLLLLCFKVKQQIICMWFGFPVEEYEDVLVSVYKIFDSYEYISSKEQYLKIIEYPCTNNEIRLSIIMLNDYKRALKVKKMLNEGEEISKLARKYSLAEGSEKGGDIGCINKNDIMDELKEPVANLNVNQISNIIEVGSSFYIIKRTK